MWVQSLWVVSAQGQRLDGGGGGKEGSQGQVLLAAPRKRIPRCPIRKGLVEKDVGPVQSVAAVFQQAEL